ncbi:MAG TPA: hypothetical protein VFX12_08885 [Vicinamibacterales bacterium]|nr:hypothetical protein [Vicinamibacterales bacterium]
MYHAVLVLHSWVRWAVLIAGVLAIVRAAAAAQRRQWRPVDGRAALGFTIALDVQFLLGLLLYFILSPITRAALHDFGGAMRNDTLRYWSVEHETGMIIALVLAHIGRARLDRRPPERRGRTALLFFVIAFVLIVLSIPWPGVPNGRPLLRGF